MKNNYYNEIKKELLNNEIYIKVKDYSKNRNELSTYYNVGKLLIEAQGGEDRAKYGDGLIKEYSLKLGVPTTQGYILLLTKALDNENILEQLPMLSELYKEFKSKELDK